MRYKHFSLLGLLSLCLLLSACSSTDKTHSNSRQSKPLWLSQTPQDSRYIYAIGIATITDSVATAQQRANDAARVELAKTIAVTLAADSQLHQAGNQQQFDYQVTENIQSSTSAENLQGVQLIESYHDKSNKTFYVLAAFDKAKAIALLEHEIAQVDLQIDQLELTQAQDKLKQLKLAAQVKQKMAHRNKLNQGLAQFQSQKIMLSELTRAQLNQANAIWQNTQFAIVQNVSRSSQTDAYSQLSSALTKQGFLLTDRQQADFILDYRIDWQLHEQSNTHFATALCPISLYFSDKKIAEFSFKAKAGSGKPSHAKQKAIAKLGERFNQQLGQQIQASFAN
ncbi:LPP20 family lipoprotein [Catenovulum sp. SM1970]|uniref:LPP20 family lipoprotein n=1 Tax=Marinifaba aquimaris TaxID=2741323 RepID=UPI0015734FDE|nr:LPP20 family lipoprotein [Marinifaba aquimaris]NTS77415.1 LPP20 family lipoprotein [Marinifaba aquimaris]